MERLEPTYEQIRVVKKEWSLLKNIRAHVIGDVFFGKLFFDYPQTRKSFDRLVADNQTDDLNEGLKNVLGGIISKLDRPDELTIRLQAVTLPFIAVGFNRITFRRLAESLLWTLQKAFGYGWPVESERAWIACISIVESQIFDPN